MKKSVSLLITVMLLFCCALCYASEAGTVTEEVNGLTFERPALPIRLAHAEQEELSGMTRYEYAWKFDAEANAVLSVFYEAYREPLDIEAYLRDMGTDLPDGAEIIRGEERTCVFFFPGDKFESFFLMGRPAAGCCACSAGTVSFFYENRALTAEETMAAVKAMVSSLRFTELTAASDEEKTIEGDAGTLEEAAALIRKGRQENAVQIILNCSSGLYDQLSENRFDLTYRLSYENGLNDMSIRYMDSGGYIELNAREYTDVPAYAWADTAEQAEAAAYGFVRDGLANFRLGCSDAVYADLLKNRGIYSVLAKLGIDDFDLRYSDDLLLIENMKPYSSEWAVVEDIYGAADQLAAWHEQGLTRFTLVFGRDAFAALTDEDRELIDFLGGVDRANSRYSSYSGAVTYGYSDSVEWAKGRSVYCPAEEDIVAAIRALGAQGVTEFRLMTTPELYGTIRASRFARLLELEALAGMIDSDMSYYSGTPIVVYSNAVIVANATMLTDPDEVNVYLTECVARQDPEINLFLSADVYNELMTGLSRLLIGKSDAKIFDLISNAGIADSHWTYSRDTHIVTIKDIRLYAGIRILLAVQNGTEASLNARDAETLSAARAIAAACTGATELETLKNIHDDLCERIVYTDDESTDEDDCAIGAILTGEANCDGYADALYLIGRLAGLEVRYQHGDSVKQGLHSMFATHMWNLVRLDGTWRLVDVTWDDTDDGDPVYVWFNIGEDRAAKTHVWSREMTVPMDPETDLSSRIDPEYFITTEDDLKAAVSDALSKGLSTFYLYVTDGSELDSGMPLSGLINRSYRYTWLDGMNAMEIIL